MHNFLDLKIWIKAIDVAERIYNLTNGFPSQEKYGIVNQMRRASVSISSNIAEGCGRNSDIELIRFLVIANGSTAELQSQVILSERLKFINEKDRNELCKELEELKNMNFKFQEALRKRNNK
jgi:four helix bundle protein